MKTPLTDYQKKRNFKKTTEPKAKLKKVKSKQLMFVIQEHHASHLHFDLRLEMEGVLRSWAVPKGPTSIPETKRLAMEVEDHPISYGSFEGVIPEGEYGAGEVLLWDTGTYETIGDPVTAYRKGHIDLLMKGKRMKGLWTLIRIRGKGERAQWFLFKRHDRYANQEARFKPIKDYGSWRSRKVEPLESQKDPMPEFIEPELALLVDTPPMTKNWIHETKFDGYRTQAHLEFGNLKLLTRRGLDWTAKYPIIAESLKKLKVDSIILDGEIVILDEQGHSDFQALQLGLKNPTGSPLLYYVFDLLYLNGYDLRDQPLSERKKLLKEIVKRLGRKNILYSEHSNQEGQKLFKNACRDQEEGIVSKRMDSTYQSGRGGDWVKVKCKNRQEFVIGGYSTGTGSRGEFFGSLLLGIYEGDKFRYVGRCGTGFTQKTLEDTFQKLKKIETPKSPFTIHSPRGRDIHFVHPKLAAEISFAEWTHDQILRVAVFHGLREDKSARDMTLEAKEIRLTHPDKVIYAKEKITKQNIADFYRGISKWILPHLKNRPLSLKRCPEGSNGPCFFQKHLKLDESSIHPIMIEENSGKLRDYATIDSLQGLVSLVQLGGYEIHVWGCRSDEIERPDQIVIDFDPDPGVPFSKVKKAAFELKKMLDDLKLKSFVKTTGGKGLHVHIPFARRYRWDQIKEFSKTLANAMVDRHPDQYTATLSKKSRKGKIFVDYLRNGRSSTYITPYSLRARETSSVAMPLEWSEMKKLKDPAYFTMAKALKHLKKRNRDPWEGFLKVKQKINILKEVH